MTNLEGNIYLLSGIFPRILRNKVEIIDTWNMIEKYNLQGWVEKDSTVILLPDSEYERLLASVKNRKYIRNLVRYQR